MIFAIGGYIGALLTAFYAFRIGFRVVFGEPVPEARELEQGHIHHAEPENPATGEKEDTDVGFPGPEPPDRRARVADEDRDERPGFRRAVRRGLVQIPGVDDVVQHFLHGSFEDSKSLRASPSTTAAEWRGLLIGALISVLGIAIAYYAYLRRPGTTTALQKRFAGSTTSSCNKWYFDEAIDLLVVRPALGIGRWANAIFERYVVNGPGRAARSTPSGAPTPRSAVAQSGYLRCYALLLVIGFAGLGLYFLIAGS